VKLYVGTCAGKLAPEDLAGSRSRRFGVSATGTDRTSGLGQQLGNTRRESPG